MTDLKRYLDLAANIFLIIGVDGKTKLINKKGCRVFGMPAKKIIGRDYFNLFIPKPERKLIRRLWSEVIAGRSPIVDYENVVVGAAGPRRVQWQSALLRDEKGRITGTLSSGEDVTERRAAEQAVKESEEKYRLLVENWPEAVFMHSGGRFLYCNPAGARLLEAPSPDFIIGRAVLDFVPPEGRGTVKARWKELRLGGKAPALEQRLVTTKGSSIWVEVVGINTTYQGKPAVQLLARDVSDRAAAREAFTESEERFRVLIEGVRDYAIFMLNPVGKIQSWNPAAQRMFGYATDEVLGRSHKILFAGDGGQAERLRAKAQLEGRAEGESWRRRKDGGVFLVHSINTALRRRDGTLRGFAAIVRDVTELRRLERETMEFSVRAQRRLGQDLHDGLGQHLTGLSLLAEALMGKLSERAPDLMGQAGRIASLAREAIDQTRALSTGLDPVEAGPEGLAAAFQNLVANASAMLRIDCVFKVKGSALVPDHAQAVQLYRIAQEAVTNAAKHGRAKRVVITLGVIDDTATLTVRDDGAGMPERPRQGGRGLQTMSHRARTMGGTLEIWNNEQGGAVVSCSVPLQEAPVIAGRKEKR